ncbi:UNVERIFIED_CONTAM: hypothetical protein FKN15_065429 [Acipenser sinensis]
MAKHINKHGKAGQTMVNAQYNHGKSMGGNCKNTLVKLQEYPGKTARIPCAGLTFVSVHDCFWTHAVTVDVMNKVCREQFVALHSQPILQNLSNFLLDKYGACLPGDRRNKKFLEYRRMLELLSKVPQTGDFDLQRVKESTYFFS